MLALLMYPFTENLETADYLQEGDVGFKKPKVIQFIYALISTLLTRTNRRRRSDHRGGRR